MKNNEKILFVTEKWCDGNPQAGLTNNYHNLFGSFKNTYPHANFHILHLDEFAVIHKKHIDSVLPRACQKLKPDIIFYSLLGDSPMNPSISTYQTIKEMGFTQCFMWPDSAFDWAVKNINLIGDVGKLHISWGSEHCVHNHLDKQMWLWCPQDETYFYPDEKTIEVSFLGSVPRYVERVSYLNYASDNGVSIFVHGGQRENGLSAKQYAEYMRKSRITINFPGSPTGIDQCKGRVIEAIACKSMLLERKNEAIKNLLIPGEDYIEFESEEDFVEKIKYYSANSVERDKIANNAYVKYKEKYSSQIFWDTIFKRLKND